MMFYIKSITIFDYILSFFNTLNQQKKKSHVIDITQRNFQ